jgi:hypothetical protein
MFHTTDVLYFIFCKKEKKKRKKTLKGVELFFGIILPYVILGHKISITTISHHVMYV